jgi:hypothetical protein
VAIVALLRGIYSPTPSGLNRGRERGREPEKWRCIVFIIFIILVDLLFSLNGEVLNSNSTEAEKILPAQFAPLAKTALLSFVSKLMPGSAGSGRAGNSQYITRRTTPFYPSCTECFAESAGALSYY